jgi:ABC-2 type transport system ATP-binding protein
LVKVQNVAKYFTKQRKLWQLVFSLPWAGQKICALDHVSVNIEPGEILGLVGPNGAGKTTLLRILADLLTPDEGQVLINGRDLSRQGRSLRRITGYVSSDERSFFWRLSGRQNLEFFGQLYGLSRRESIQRSNRLLDEFDLGKKADHWFGGYSAGMRKKCAVMRALMHCPRIVLLDEVTNSLDPESAHMVKTRIKEYVHQKEGRAAVWSTHRLEETAEVCTKVLKMDAGRGNVYYPEKGVKDGARASGYLVKLQNLNGNGQAFHERCRWMLAEAKLEGGISSFLFKGISNEDFGRILTMAVKDYGAFVVFAGCVNKQENGK